MNHQTKPASPRRIRATAIIAAATALVLAATACASAVPSTIYVYTTPTPPPTGTPTPVATATPTLTPVPTDTPVGGSPSPSVSASASASPSAGPTGVAGGCSGSVDNQAFFVQAAKALTFPIYCAAMPSGWYFDGATYQLPSGGWLRVAYKGPNGAHVVLQEGAYCTTGASACSPHDSVIGSAKFGDLNGSLDSLGPSLGFAIYVNPGTTRAYTATATGVSQAAFVSIAAGVLKVPKA